MKKRVPTVTVALSAFNEEQNIVSCLRSILTQKERGFILEKVLVISDGSTDTTVSEVKSLKDPRLEVRAYRARAGKSTRFNLVYRSLKSDILVQTDADVRFSHPHVIAELIKPLVSDPHVGMCGGNPLPLAPITFNEKAIYVTTQAYIPLRLTIRNGQNLYSADDKLLAFSRELAMKLHIPRDMIADDIYKYFCCLVNGFEYRYARSATVDYRLPQTLADHVRQNTRFQASRQRMEKYFPKSLVDREFHIPRLLFWRVLLSQFLRHPLLSGFIFVVNRFNFINSKFAERSLTSQWQIASSTKKLTASLW